MEGAPCSCCCACDLVVVFPAPASAGVIVEAAGCPAAAPVRALAVTGDTDAAAPSTPPTSSSTLS